MAPVLVAAPPPHTLSQPPPHGWVGIDISDIIVSTSASAARAASKPLAPDPGQPCLCPKGAPPPLFLWGGSKQGSPPHMGRDGDGPLQSGRDLLHL